MIFSKVISKKEIMIIIIPHCAKVSNSIAYSSHHLFPSNWFPRMRSKWRVISMLSKRAEADLAPRTHRWSNTHSCNLTKICLVTIWSINDVAAYNCGLPTKSTNICIFFQLYILCNVSLGLEIPLICFILPTKSWETPLCFEQFLVGLQLLHHWPTTQ